MAGLSEATRSMLNKGQSLYKAGLGDAIHNALVEAAANKAADTADASEDTQWGNDLAASLDAKASKRELNEVVEIVVSKVGKAEVVAAIDAAVTAHHKETVELLSTLASKVEDVKTLVVAVNTLASKIDSLKAAVLAGFAKADDDATITDTNYEATVLALLS